jgi:Tfp pilus assembly protein PilZ
VRYSTAREFVQEYAQNLSSGGLFVRDAADLQALQQVDVRVELPGFGEFDVTAEVVHIVTPEQAKQYQIDAGAGLAIVKAPPGFDNNLKAYLWRLGRRKDFIIMISDEPTGILLGATGYRVKRVPVPDELRDAVEQAGKPVVGILVPSNHFNMYLKALQGSDEARLLYAIDQFENIDLMLASMDEELLLQLKDEIPQDLD